MKYSIEINLDPIIIEALEEIGKSDTIESNISNMLIQYIKNRYQKICEMNLQLIQKNVINQVKNKKISIENLNLDILPLTPEQEKVRDEKNRLLGIIDTLNLFKQGKLTNDDLETYKQEFLTLKLKDKEEKINSLINQQQSPREIQSIKILKNDVKRSEFRDREDHSSLEFEKSVLVTTENLMDSLSTEWQNIKDLIFKMRLRDMMDARYLQVKLKELERKESIEMKIIMGKSHWRLKTK